MLYKSVFPAGCSCRSTFDKSDHSIPLGDRVFLDVLRVPVKPFFLSSFVMIGVITAFLRVITVFLRYTRSDKTILSVIPCN